MDKSITPGKKISGSLSLSHGKSPRKIKIHEKKYHSKEQGISLTSRIPDDLRIVESGPFSKPFCESTFDPMTSTWQSTTLPRREPSSRDDVLKLDGWLTNRLVEINCNKQLSDTEMGKERLKLFEMGFSELVRQVALSCKERGELLNRIWKSNNEVYSNLVEQLSDVIKTQHARLNEMHTKNQMLQNQLNMVEYQHEKDMKALMASLESNKSEDTSIFRDLQEELFQREKDMHTMENLIADLHIWFPNFPKYCNSVLRKHLPPIDQAHQLLTTMSSIDEIEDSGAGFSPKPKIQLPQELLFQDVKRLQDLDIGLVISKDTYSDANRSRLNSVDDVAASPTPSRRTSSAKEADESRLSISLKRPIKPSAKETSLRSLLVENQLQSVVVDDLQNKYNALVASSSEQAAKYRYIIERLSSENSHLKSTLEGKGGSCNVLFPFPNLFQVSGGKSISWEINELFRGRKTQSGAAPSGIISIPDMQKAIQDYLHSLFSECAPVGWYFDDDCSMDNLNGEKRFELKGITGGLKGGDLKVMNFEDIFGKYLLLRFDSSRGARDYLRKLQWSLINWAHSYQAGVSLASRRSVNSTVDDLPRSMLEHEKSMIHCYCNLFALPLNEKEPLNPEEETILEIEKKLFLNNFLKSYRSMQRFVHFNPKSSGFQAAMSGSSNLFLSGSSCKIPTIHLEKTLSKLFTVSRSFHYVAPEVRRKSLSMAISAIGVGDDVDLTNWGSFISETWWSFIPSSVYDKMKEEVLLLPTKYGGEYAEVYDVIATVHSCMKLYMDTLMYILEEVYKYVDGCTGGPFDPMFHTLIIALLEKKGTKLSPQHRMLSSELISLSLEGKLNAKAFARTVLKNADIVMSGIHILFDTRPRIKRDLKKEASQLLQHLSLIASMEEDEAPTIKMKSHFHNSNVSRNVSTVSHSEVTSFRKTNSPFASRVGGHNFDAVLSHAVLCLDEGDISSQNQVSASYPMISFSLDLFFAYTTMKYLTDMNSVAETRCTLRNISKELQSITYRSHTLLKKTFFAFRAYCDRLIQNRKDDLSDDESELSDSGSFSKLETIASGGTEEK